MCMLGPAVHIFTEEDYLENYPIMMLIRYFIIQIKMYVTIWLTRKPNEPLSPEAVFMWALKVYKEHWPVRPAVTKLIDGLLRSGVDPNAFPRYYFGFYLYTKTNFQILFCDFSFL